MKKSKMYNKKSKATRNPVSRDSNSYDDQQDLCTMIKEHKKHVTEKPNKPNAKDIFE